MLRQLSHWRATIGLICIGCERKDVAQVSSPSRPSEPRWTRATPRPRRNRRAHCRARVRHTAPMTTTAYATRTNRACARRCHRCARRQCDRGARCNVGAVHNIGATPVFERGRVQLQALEDRKDDLNPVMLARRQPKSERCLARSRTRTATTAGFAGSPRGCGRAICAWHP